MNSLKSTLLAPVTGAALVTASLVIQTSTLAANVSQDRVETPRQLASQPAAPEPCKQYRWVHVGHPEKGYNRRVCVEPAAESSTSSEQPSASQAMDHDGQKCKKYVREHYGPPGKGVDTVKVVYVPCPQKR